MKLFICIMLLCGLASKADGDLSNPSTMAAFNAYLAGGGGGGFPQSGSVIHHLAMEEASGNRQDAVGTMHMTPVGTVTQTTGKNGNGVDIAASSGLTNLVTALDINYPFTVAMWVKSADTTPASLQRMFSTDDMADIEIALTTSGNARLIVGGDGDSLPAAALGANDAWHLVVVSADDLDEIRLSVDGSTWVAGNSYVADLSAEGAGRYVGVGCATSGGGGLVNTFIGQMDEVTVWATGLSQEEVTTLWNSGNGTFYTP